MGVVEDGARIDGLAHLLQQRDVDRVDADLDFLEAADGGDLRRRHHLGEVGDQIEGESAAEERLHGLFPALDQHGFVVIADADPGNPILQRIGDDPIDLLLGRFRVEVVGMRALRAVDASQIAAVCEGEGDVGQARHRHVPEGLSEGPAAAPETGVSMPLMPRSRSRPRRAAPQSRSGNPGNVSWSAPPPRRSADRC